MNGNKDSQQGAPRRSLRRVGGGVRMHTIRRQLYIYLAMIAAGAYFIAESGLEKLHLISEGVAFIMVGAVGLIMSSTTTDIGQNIMFAIREEGDKTRASQSEANTRIIEAIREDGDKTRASQSEANTRIIEAIREDGDKTRASQSEANTRIIEAIREEGDKTRASQSETITRFMEAIREDGGKTRTLIAENGERLDGRLDRMTSAIVSVSNDIKAVSNDIKAMSADNREFFRQMLEAQNRILEKVS